MSLGDLQEGRCYDTPGHVDFSAEMERTLRVLDYAIPGDKRGGRCTGTYTDLLWRLLGRYRVPVFLFINKMDQDGTDRGKLLAELKNRLDDGCIDLRGTSWIRTSMRSLAMCDEAALGIFWNMRRWKRKTFGG